MSLHRDRERERHGCGSGLRPPSPAAAHALPVHRRRAKRHAGSAHAPHLGCAMTSGGPTAPRMEVEAGPDRGLSLVPRRLRDPPRRGPAGRRDDRLETPAFLRRRVRAAAYGTTDQRPRFRAARGFLAKIGSDLRFATCEARRVVRRSVAAIDQSGGTAKSRMQGRTIRCPGTDPQHRKSSEAGVLSLPRPDLLCAASATERSAPRIAAGPELRHARVPRVAGRSSSLTRCPPPSESRSHDRSVGFGHRSCHWFDPASLHHRGVVATPGRVTTLP